MTERILYTRQAQDIKGQRLARAFSWIGQEFQDIHTINDVELYNTERYAKLHLHIHFT